MDRLALAFHEGSHAAMAAARGVEFNLVTIDPGPLLPEYHGLVAFAPGDPAHKANRAAIAFAGPWAEAKITGTSLGEILMRPSSRSDVADFRGVGCCTNRRQYREWSEELESLWPTIEQMAARLLLAGSLTPNDPDPLQDPAQIAAFLESLR